MTRCGPTSNCLRFLIVLSWALLLIGASSTTRAAEPDPQLRARLLAAISNTTGFTDRFDAEVWLMDMSQRLSRRIPDSRQRLDFLRLVHSEATRAGLAPELVLAVIDIESDFNQWAISASGAQGLMQVMPFWLREIGHPKDNLFRPATNLRLGCTILKYYLDMEHGHLRPALARYNGSFGQRQYPDKVFAALNSRWYRQ
jgi:soluble lytic murein transglycosylase-like protein